LKKVLIADRVHPFLIEGLEQHGYVVDYEPTISLVDISKIIGDYEGIIVNSKSIMDKKMIDLGNQLEFIGRLGSGLEIIDIPYAKSRNIRVINSPEGNRNAVAEHVMGMLLSLFNNINRADREVRNFDWNREKNRGQELHGKTIGIIGFGNTGRVFAEKLSHWHVKVLAYDKYKKNYAADLPHVQETDLNQVFAHSDIISLHLQLTDETRYYVDDAFYDNMKKGAILINSSRGSMIRTNELIKQLDIGKIGGVCLDVFENEKPETYTKAEKEMYHNLYQRDNVVLTPHVAGWTDRSLKLIAEVLVQKITDKGV